jgi:hypothetical protein
MLDSVARFQRECEILSVAVYLGFSVEQRLAPMALAGMDQLETCGRRNSYIWWGITKLQLFIVRRMMLMQLVMA